MSFHQPRPIVIVTGANSGVGFGICHRLLLQLSRSLPPDSLPQPSLSPYYATAEDGVISESAYDGLTLILACRSVKRAEDARTKLLNLLDADIAQQKTHYSYDGHADVFRRNLQVVVHYVDLSIVRSIFQFREEIRARYPYVSHLICNAGIALFNGLDWPLCVKQLAVEYVAAVTSPVYKLQTKGEMSADGLGLVWQCNMFGHYVLHRTLQPLTTHYFTLSSLPARVIWISSIEALPSCYNPDDWQFIDNDHSYEASKYAIDLLAGSLQQQSSVVQEGGRKQAAVRHLLVQPGIVVTNISSTAIDWWLSGLMVLSFYLARLLGSPNHPIRPYKSAISAVHSALVPIALLSFSRSEEPSADLPTGIAKPAVAEPDAQRSSPTTNGNGNANGHPTNHTSMHATHQSGKTPPLKFSSETSFWGRERVGASMVEKWEENREESARLLEKCERLYQTFLSAEGQGHKAKI